MPVKYEYDPELRIIHACPYGDLIIDDIVSYFMKVAKDIEIHSGVIEVVYFDNVENYLFSSNDALQIPGRYEEMKVKKNIRCTIFIGEDDIHYGVARMFQNLFGVDNRPYDMFVVRTEAEATDLIKNING